MALTEKQEWKVEVIPPYSILQIRRADIILKDGEEVARSYHRHVLNPGADVSKEAKVVQEVAGGVWTEECCALYHEEVVQPQIDAEKIEQPTTLPAPEEEPAAGTADVKKQTKR